MKKLLIGFLTIWLIAGCGGGTSQFGSGSSSSSSSTSSTTSTVAAVNVLASSPQLLSDDSNPVTITALVLNAANQTIASAPVIIQTDSGYLTDVSTVTTAAGTATATLHTSDPTNRTVTVTATSGTSSSTVSVSITGTKLAINGSTGVAQNTQASYTITLTDAGGKGIANQAVTIASSKSNTLSASTLITDTNGKATVLLTGTVAGNDTLSASALGLTATQAVSVSGDSFAFSTPAANTEIAINQSATFTVVWRLNNVAQAAQSITFASTRGTVSASSAVTNGAGQATVTISSTNSGPATVTATTPTGIATQVNVEFVATTPSALNVQASPASIGISGQSTITAVVRDANNNLVKNQIVQFNLTDTTGGSLSVASATTDSQGRAQTIYTASSTTSAANGVQITATVQGTAVSGSTALTVAQQQVFITLGTGNKIAPDSTNTQYLVPYVIQVTDANGNGVANVPLSISALSLYYGTGSEAFINNIWQPATSSTTPGYVDVCPDEDTLLGPGNPGYRNGVLDPGEDHYQHDGKLEAGNIATVTPTGVTTDSSGFAHINVVYPEEYAYWVYISLTASASVQGSESSRTATFWLPGAAADFGTATSAPPGEISPFGTANYNCP